MKYDYEFVFMINNYYSFSMDELISEVKNAKPDKITYMSEVYESNCS